LGIVPLVLGVKVAGSEMAIVNGDYLGLFNIAPARDDIWAARAEAAARWCLNWARGFTGDEKQS